MEVPAPDESEDPALVVVGEWPSFSEADEHALVGLATNHECWIFPFADGFAVWAKPETAPALRREFSLYATEQAERRERVEPPLFPAGIELMLLWVIALTAVYMLQGRDAAFTDRFCNSSRALVEGGEWWRPFTALFLHADAGHLLSNVGIGGIFCVMAAQTLGLWRAWLLILVSGSLGNAVNAWSHYPADFNSLGASTATFGALGLLIGSALAYSWKAHSLRELRSLLAPLIVGLTMLGMYGVGGEQTDVAGHFAGWSFGVLLGSLARRKDLPFARPEQALAGLPRSPRQMDS
ncbi:rhomboid family intramembrane serine protease [Haloferula sp. BvORR071]|uniref:rhomboid family intramembrane serine protease n=1 Tax=Haloferula sp. BvORR071 TaxID=1396141 RepID=UPI002240F7E0|nr:rhomboid family intramembrane serine protease [Haloferula sp. BvORR071]